MPCQYTGSVEEHAMRVELDRVTRLLCEVGPMVAQKPDGLSDWLREHAEADRVREHAEATTHCCRRCGDKAYGVWGACADPDTPVMLCRECDAEFNAMLLRWLGDADWRRKVEAYRLESVAALR